MSAQAFEREFWGNCANTFHEEEKQLVYARYMGLMPVPNAAHPPTYLTLGKSIVDVGGGPVSLLLKTVGAAGRVVVDPAVYPSWVEQRYMYCGIGYVRKTGEAFKAHRVYDECWIYNCLQHVEDPEKLIANARSFSRLIRMFEWIDIPAYEGHPHELTANALMRWLRPINGRKIIHVNESGAVGRAFIAITATDV